MGNVQTIQPVSSYITIPPTYPATPTPGKLEILFTTNKTKLWHRLSPYTDYDSSGLLGSVFGSSEPYYYVYADQNTGLNALRKYQTSIFPMGSAPIDVIRVSKFLISGRGIGFLATQFLLQRANAFNETRIYNPISPLAASGMALTFNQIRPQRFIDTSGLAGIAGSLLGNVGTAIFGAPENKPPTGTVGIGALSYTNQNSGKGLLRSGTANTAKSLLELKWPLSSGNNPKGGFLSTIKGLVQGLVDNFVTPEQTDISKRSDEGTYGRMLLAGSLSTTDGDTRFGYYGASGKPFGFTQRWVGGLNSKSGIRKNDEYPTTAGRLINGPNGESWVVSNDEIANPKDWNLTSGEAGKLEKTPLGYTIKPSTKQSSPGVRYGDSVGTAVDKDFESSDIILQYQYYVNQTFQYPTKKTDPASVAYINAELEKILTGPRSIPKIGNGNIYSINLRTNSQVIQSPVQGRWGYDQLYIRTNGLDRSRGKGPLTYPGGMMHDYAEKNIILVDENLKTSGNRSYKLPTNGTFDAINTLNVLPANRKIGGAQTLKDWPMWEPYKDDLIAVYFYDIVNEKYIPFRAAIKGLTESGNVSWEELSFIGRADKVYSYGGFNRNLSLSIKIVIGSIAELAPTWQRINYMASAIKPANYTSATSGNTTDRFIVPPMFFLTIGDLYKDQPILIQSVTITIPDDAAWETLNEDNTPYSKKDGTGNWNYLAQYITSPDSGGKFAQVPREVDLNFSFYLLEKERAIIGGANFGHAPRIDKNNTWHAPMLWDGNTDKVAWNINIPLGSTPNQWSKDLVVGTKPS